MSKRKEREAIRKEASKIMRTMEIEMLAERKPDKKAYERFKQKPYTTSGGVAIGQALMTKKKECEGDIEDANIRRGSIDNKRCGKSV